MNVSYYDYICTEITSQLYANMLKEELRRLREQRGLLLRQVAALMNCDTATISKIERGVVNVREEQLVQLSNIYNVDLKGLKSLWIADKIVNMLKTNSDIAKQAIEIVNSRINSKLDEF